MKTNLLLLDSLHNMENLIKSGFSLSDQLKRKLKIVYVFDFSWIGSGQYVGTVAPTIDAALISVEKEVRQDFEKAESRIRELTAAHLRIRPYNIPFEIEVVEMSRLDYVNKYLEEEKDVLLIVSNYNSYTNYSSGAVIYPNVIDKVGCPVLVLPEDQQTGAFDHIVYASALHQEDLLALRHLSGLFSEAKGKALTVFHHEKSMDFDEELKWRGFQSVVQNTINTFNYSFDLSLQKDLKESLETFVKEGNPDLIVLLKEKKGFFKDVFTSSETRHAVTHFDKPVLVYHEENLSK